MQWINFTVQGVKQIHCIYKKSILMYAANSKYSTARINCILWRVDQIQSTANMLMRIMHHTFSFF